MIQFDVEVTDRVAPDATSGKLKRITSQVGPPEHLAADGRGASDDRRPGSPVTAASSGDR